MENIAISDLKLGIIAGGQLAKMLIQEASKWDISTYVLDEDDQSPARCIASHFIQGSQRDYQAVYAFGKQVDVLTFEIENVNVDALRQLKKEGLRIHPDPEILALIQDKGTQKEFYQRNGIPTAAFRLYDEVAAIRADLNTGTLNFPFVQKLRVGGYDGRGVAVINDEAGLSRLLPGPSVVEDRVDVTREISVIAARNRKGEVKCFPVVEMIFDPQANLVDKLICPSTITIEQSEKAKSIASELVDVLEMEGILAVEFFVDARGDVIVNEMAPRPHNSGHHTIESMITSQFEQQLRAILNLPLGSVRMKLPAVMVNMLGEEGCEGPVKYEGLTESMRIEGVKIHLYGKKHTKPFRKMGHVTVLSNSLECALGKAEKVKNLIKVRSWDKSV